jgi:hypothetical protein
LEDSDSGGDIHLDSGTDRYGNDIMYGTRTDCALNRVSVTNNKTTVRQKLCGCFFTSYGQYMLTTAH